MSFNLLRFRSIADLMGYLEGQISALQSRMAELAEAHRRLKMRAERLKKLEEALSSLVGEQFPPLNEIDLMGVKIVVGARAVDELKVVEEVLAHLNDKFNALQKSRQALEPLAKTVGDEGGGFEVIVETVNDIPFKILLKEVS